MTRNSFNRLSGFFINTIYLGRDDYYDIKNGKG